MTSIATVQTAAGIIVFLLPNFPGIPAEFHRLPMALWKAELELDKTGKPLFKANGRPRIKKAPRNPAGFNVSKNRPEEWVQFPEIESTFDSKKFTGIGVLLQANSGLVGIDLDDIQELFDSNQHIKNLVDRARDLGIYCEKSPSSTGLRMFVRGQLPGHAGKRKGGIELYSSAAFLTLTGEHEWPGVIKDGQWLINELLNVIGSATQRRDFTLIEPLVTDQAVDPSVVESLCNWASHNHPRLWTGPWDKPLGILDDKQYPSQSEADMALVGHLAREALRLGCPPSSAAAAVMKTFEKSCLFRANKKLQVAAYAIPKALQTAIDSNQVSAPNPMDLARNHGDVLTGRLFAHMWKDRFLFVAKTGKWLRWDINSQMWVWCHMREELHACKEVAQGLLILGSKTITNDPSEGKRLLSIGAKAHDLKQLEAMLKLAPTEPEMSVLPTELDSDPWLLGVQNGVVNLRTGELLQNQPKYLITRRCAASYDKDAKCDLWIKFFGRNFS
jgi:putative DNA primase/helicase